MTLILCHSRRSLSTTEKASLTSLTWIPSLQQADWPCIPDAALSVHKIHCKRKLLQLYSLCVSSIIIWNIKCKRTALSKPAYITIAMFCSPVSYAYTRLYHLSMNALILHLCMGCIQVVVVFSFFVLFFQSD